RQLTVRVNHLVVKVSYGKDTQQRVVPLADPRGDWCEGPKRRIPRRREDRPARRVPGTGVERPGTANRGGEQVADVFAAARHDGGALQDRVAAATRGAAGVQGDDDGGPVGGEAA